MAQIGLSQQVKAREKYLPTPSAQNDYQPGKTWNPAHQSGRSLGLMAKLNKWPTPQAHKTTRSGEIVNADGTPWDGISKPHSKTTGKPITSCLADSVAMWPTPKASPSGPDFARVNRKGSGGDDLVTAVAKRIPTPTAGDAKSSGSRNLPGSKAHAGVSLTDFVRLPTPMARDWKSGKASAATHAKNSRPLSEQIGGQLAPNWVELLMGWPNGWTSLDAGLPGGKTE